jgi:DNA-binding NarL/FixJ family response regulator
VVMRILIADDNVEVRTELRRALNNYDEWVICAEAENGQEAVSKTEEQRPDVVILDLSMPVMNGLQACREIKRMFPSVPVFIYTLQDSSSLESEARKVGARGVIQKGWPVPSLIAALEERLRN